MQKKKTDLALVDTETAAQLIADGGILAYPTEGVFGIGCDPSNTDAIAKLLHVKSRDPSKGLILIAASIEQIATWIEPLTPAQRQRIGDTWPGPVTWILPAKTTTPAALTGGRATLAARVTAHPPAVALCLAAKTAIVSTSANLSGEPPARHPEQLHSLNGLDACLNAEIGHLAGPTPIFDVSTGIQLRA